MPHLFYIIFVFALGSCVGSFLNVVVWRLPRGESLVTPPSHCPKCDRRLKWYDNIPVLGWIILPFASLGILIVWIMTALKALKGERYQLPIIGKYAAQQAGA